MKTIIALNLRPMRRTFCTILIGIAALWDMLGSARAQIYVSQEVSSSTGTVGEYDATTGAVINANLITGVIHPAGLVLSGNTLFVASAVANGGSVGTYDATTGAVINTNFISTGVNQVNQPFALALSGNTLFVSDAGERITTYNATTGSPFTTVFNPLISGLANPYNLALSGNNLYVSQNLGGSSLIGEYNATTGATINANFITTTPVGAFGLALSGNHLFVSSGQDLGTGVAEYDATTGAVINASFISGIQDPLGLAVVGNTLYVSQDNGTSGSSVISTYNATTGALIKANFITGLNGAGFIAVASVPEPPPWSMVAVGGVALVGMMHRRKHRIA